MRSCEICGIKERHSTEKLFFARFPLDEQRCKEWVKLTGNEDLAYIPIEKLHQNKYVCGNHFKPKDFKRKKTKLRKTAVPSIDVCPKPLSDEVLAEFPLHIAKDQETIKHVAQIDDVSSDIDTEIFAVPSQSAFVAETIVLKGKGSCSPSSDLDEVYPSFDCFKPEIMSISEETMELPPKPKKQRGLSREELLKLSKEELVDRLIQTEKHIFQLKNIINRNVSETPESDSGKKPQKKFDFTKCHFRPILLQISYFGWDYQGFVVQEDTINTIEHHLFKALTKACFIENRESSNYHRCGRTDKGVSAFGQVISLKIRSKHSPETQNDSDSIASEISYCTILNRILPKDIRAVAWMPVMDDFSARFDCKKRQYKYYFPKSSLNISSMREACKHLLGSHDFRNLCKMDVGNGVVEFRREIITADIVAMDDDYWDEPTSMYYLLIEGNAFLWHQIRCIQAILLLIGTGLESVDIIPQLLQCERKPQYNLAIDVPLNLFKCTYEDNNWIYSKDNLELVIEHLQEEWTILNIKAIMMKDCIKALEEQYYSSFEDIGSYKIICYHNCLTQGVKPKRYLPLMKRPTCSSLQEKIAHYRKRRKIHETEDTAGIS